jgi:hypothetical protein
MISDTFLSELEADLSSLPPATTLKEIADLAERQMQLAAKIDKANAYISDLNQQLKTVQEVLLPEALIMTGLHEVKLANGSKVTIKRFYSASISDENRDEAFSWLYDNNYSDLIKNDFSIKFGKGDDEEADNLKELLDSNGIEYAQKTHVHPQTLAAFVKEQVEKGADFPMQTFKVYIGNKAIIK